MLPFSSDWYVFQFLSRGTKVEVHKKHNTACLIRLRNLATIPEGRLEIEAVKSNVSSRMFGSDVVEVTQGWWKPNNVERYNLYSSSLSSSPLPSSSSYYYYYYYCGVKIEEYKKCMILSTYGEDMYVCMYVSMYVHSFTR